MYQVYLSILLHIAEHHNAPALLLPYHPPEVLYSGGHWTLGGNVGTRLPVALGGINNFLGLPFLLLNLDMRLTNAYCDLEE